MNRAIRGSLLLASLVLAHGCADVNGPAGSMISIDGIWDFTDEVVSNQTSCSDTGSVAIVSQDSTFKGLLQSRGHCITGSLGYGYTVLDSVKAGVIRGDTIVFIETYTFGGGALCSDTAHFVTGAADADSLYGRSTCSRGAVTWRATRASPVGSVTIVRPVTGLMPTASTQGLAAELRSASGAPLFLRPLVWSSDNPSVVTVSAAGVVRAVAPGSATVRVSSGGHADSIGINVPQTVGLVATDAGAVGSCALDASGDPYCWGIAPGQRSVTPLKVNGLYGFKALTVGYEFACGLDSLGLASCWGRNGSGQLGNGTVFDTTAPRPVSGGIHFASITAGGDHACGLTAAGVAWCWGSNATGQLGIGSVSTGSTTPTAVSGALTFTAISAGNGHTCAIATSTARAWCWGANTLGQLGDSSTTQRTAPVAIGGGISFASISAGDRRSCGVTTAGSAWCWGEEGFGGSLGTGTTGNQNAPRLVLGGLTFTMISTGGNHVCGIVTGGAAWCWGANFYGQLGNGTTTTGNAPIAVSGGLTFTTISSGLYTYSDETHNEGTSAHTCAVTTAGATWCWGDNIFGELGNGNHGDGNYSAVPVKVAGQP